MKSTYKTDLPIISASDNSDERVDGVFLIDAGIDEKTTAESHSDYWHLITWEIYDVDGAAYWFDRSSFTVDKDTVNALAALQSLEGDKE